MEETSAGPLLIEVAAQGDYGVRHFRIVTSKSEVVGMTREEIRLVLGGWKLPQGTQDDVVLAASELVANLVEHGEAATADLTITRVATGQTLLRLWDSVPGARQVRIREFLGERGRGLQIVKALGNYAVEVHPQGEAIVWTSNAA